MLDERLSNLAGTATLVGWYAFLVFSIAAFAQLVVGYLVDNYPVRTIFASLAVVQAILFTMMIQLTGVGALVVAIAFMFFIFGEVSINDVLVGRMAHSEWRSRAYSLTCVIFFVVSALTVPLIAWIHANWGFDLLFGILATSACLIFIAALFLPKTEPAAAETPAAAG